MHHNENANRMQKVTKNGPAWHVQRMKYKTKVTVNPLLTDATYGKY